MNLNNISFKSSLLNQLQQQSRTVVATTSTLPIVEKKDSVELSTKSNKKTVAKIVTTGVLLIFAFIKRKTICNFFKNLFKKTKSQIDVQKETEKFPQVATENVANKIKFPKPQFTCGPEKADQYAAEKKAYVDDVIKYLHSTNSELQLKTINAIEKYGTWEHGDKLGAFLGHRDEKIVVPVVRAIAATGGPRQVLLVNSFIKTPENYSQNTYFEILDAIAKLGDMKKLTTGGRNQVSNTLNTLKHHENSEIAKKANETLKIIFNK